MRRNVLAASPMKPHEHEQHIVVNVVPESVVLIGSVRTMLATASFFDKLNLACSHNFAQVTAVIPKPHQVLGLGRRYRCIHINGTCSNSEV